LDDAGDKVVGKPIHLIVVHRMAPPDRGSERGMELSVATDIEQKIFPRLMVEVTDQEAMPCQSFNADSSEAVLRKSRE
jgi:hypothetical protein